MYKIGFMSARVHVVRNQYVATHRGWHRTVIFGLFFIKFAKFIPMEFIKFK